MGRVLLLDPSAECLKISRNMRQIAVAVVTVLLVAVQIPYGFTYPSTVPAFLWSPHEDGYSRGTSGAKPADSSVVDFLKDYLVSSMENRGKQLYSAREDHILKFRCSLSLSVLWSSLGLGQDSAPGNESVNSTACDAGCS